jgi:glycosyltransferase involved in cell wall biosynthesis
MKLLLVGPYPPPHGGISVHVAALRRTFGARGIDCRVVCTDPHAVPVDGALAIRGGLDLVRHVHAHACDGFVVHVHTNGANAKSWMVALAAGAAARSAPRRVLTLHSGLLPRYLAHAAAPARALARRAAGRFDRLVAVNDAIRSALIRIGVPPEKTSVRPAFVPPPPPSGTLPDDVDAWGRAHAPLLATALFFRHEYGFDWLVEALARLRRVHPRVGCLVMGDRPSDEAAALVRINGLERAVRFLGDVDHDACRSAIARADVFVRATRADGDSISVREALALGVPTVASAVGRRPAAVRLVPAGDVEALVAAIERARQEPRGLPMPFDGDTASDLLELYTAEPRPSKVATHARAILRG